jgi:hypothetical protein
MFRRDSRRPSSAVVETEFGLSKSKPQRLGGVLALNLFSYGPDGFPAD